MGLLERKESVEGFNTRVLLRFEFHVEEVLLFVFAGSVRVAYRVIYNDIYLNNKTELFDSFDEI